MPVLSAARLTARSSSRLREASEPSNLAFILLFDDVLGDLTELLAVKDIILLFRQNDGVLIR